MLIGARCRVCVSRSDPPEVSVKIAMGTWPLWMLLPGPPSTEVFTDSTNTHSASICRRYVQPKYCSNATKTGLVFKERNQSKRHVYKYLQYHTGDHAAWQAQRALVRIQEAKGQLMENA